MRSLSFLNVAFILLLAAFCAPAANAVEYKGRTFLDPFADPPASSVVPSSQGAVANDTKKGMLSQLSIQGILVSPGGNMAIINGKVAKVGTLIQDFQILSIESDGVTIKSGDHSAYKLPYNRRASS